MPSKNGFNKPTNQMKAHKKTQIRAAKFKNTQTFQRKPSSAELFKSTKIDKTSHLTNKKKNLTTETLSNKKLKKIQRNLNYLKNNGIESKILQQLEEQKEKCNESNALVESSSKRSQPSLKDQSQFVRDALWSVLEDSTSVGIAVDATGEGTTLGHAGFY